MCLQHRVTLSTACGLLFLLSGCLISASSRESYSGTRVPEKFAQQVVIGETTKNWLTERLGPPTSVLEHADGTEVLRYRSSRRVKAHVAILFLINVSDVHERQSVAVFKFKDDVLQDYYWEHFGDDGDSIEDID